MTPEGYSLRGWRLLQDKLRQRSFRDGRIFGMKINLGAAWSDSGRLSSGEGIGTNQELWMSQWEAFSCMNMY